MDEIPNYIGDDRLFHNFINHYKAPVMNQSGFNGSCPVRL